MNDSVKPTKTKNKSGWQDTIQKSYQSDVLLGCKELIQHIKVTQISLNKLQVGSLIPSQLYNAIDRKFKRVIQVIHHGQFVSILQQAQSCMGPDEAYMIIKCTLTSENPSNQVLCSNIESSDVQCRYLVSPVIQRTCTSSDKDITRHCKLK